LKAINLLDEIKHAQDIETISYDDNLLKNSGNGKFTLEDGKLLNMENNSDFKDDIEKE
jgi:hypothetical protein